MLAADSRLPPQDSNRNPKVAKAKSGFKLTITLTERINLICQLGIIFKCMKGKAVYKALYG